MLLRALATSLLLLCGFVIQAHAETPQIDLYTMGVGDDVVEKFGHAALCTRYANSPNRDRCYNYGTTNFLDPAGLGWSFVRGRARFWVSITTPTKMMDLYIRRDRTVWIQELPLSPEQASAVADKLHYDSLKANRYYVYHHYFDNCTTRIRDILDEHSGGLLSDKNNSGFGATYRELSRRGFAESTGLLVASDYVLGRIGDTEPSVYQAMFLPTVLREQVRSRMGAEPMVLYEREGAEPSREPGMIRIYMLLFGLILVMPIWVRARHGSVGRFALAPAAIYLSLVGILLWALAVLSPLPMARYNEALLLYVPFDLVLFWLGPRARSYYCRVRVLIVLLATIAASIGLLSQPLWAIAPMPLMALLPLVFGATQRSSRLELPRVS